MAKKSKKVAAAFHEVFHNKPKTVDTSKSPEGQRKQMIAIALSKARQAGAKIPKGGNTDLSRDSMKGAALCKDRVSNLQTKREFVKRRINGTHI
jgi:hypothetical protein